MGESPEGIEDDQASLTRGPRSFRLGIEFFGCLILLAIGFFVIFFPVYLGAKPAPPGAVSLSNMKQLSLGLIMYSDDWNERLPSSTAWCDAIEKYVGSGDLFHDPTLAPPEERRYGYAMNRATSLLVATTVRNPATVVALFASIRPGRNAVGASQDLRPNGGQVIIGRLDGSGCRVPITDALQLAWNASARRP